MLIACNKPQGISSFDVVKIIRTHFQEKVGHSGTLDPMATGLMILGVGNGTKKLATLIGLDKCYETVIDFSLLTDTRDASFWQKEEKFDLVDQGIVKDGILVLKPDLNQISALLDTLLYQQGNDVLLPLPTFSAKKQNGRRMYKDARKGTAEIMYKEMKIYKYEILDYVFPYLKVRFEVGSGTYIRSIGYRLGKQLGLGGTLIELERIKIGKRALNQVGTTTFAQGNIKGSLRTIFFKEIEC